MRLKNVMNKLWHRGQNKAIKRLLPISWRKLIPGLLLIALGIWAGSFYIKDNTVMLWGIIAALAIAGGGFLSFQGIKPAESGFAFTQDGKKKQTGKENAIIWFAKHKAETSKDVPVILKFAELTHPPIGARLHYLKNFKKHYYELFNNTKTKTLEPVILPDKIPFPPGLFKIPAAMQTYKDAIEYIPPTLMQKIAPGIILLAMGIVGLLMVMTTG